MMRELDKHGEIDYGLFIKSRFCRIWPMIAVITAILMLASYPYTEPENENLMTKA